MRRGARTRVEEEEGYGMNWDDLRYVLALSKTGTLAKAAKQLRVNHSTVGRHVESAETTLGVRLFARTKAGYVLTADGERVVKDLAQVESAVHRLERGAEAQRSAVEGTVRITTSETLGCTYIAPLLTGLRELYPRLAVDLVTTGKVLDLSRREADIAVRLVRSQHESLVVRRAALVAYGLYASASFLTRNPVAGPEDIARHPLLTCVAGPKVVDATWLASHAGDATPALICDLTMALLEAAKAGAGIAVLPRYLGDAEASLRRIAMPDEPTEPVWVTVHRDLRETARVRAVLDYLASCFERDRTRLNPLEAR